MPDYKPKRTRNIYSPGQDKPFKLSRSKVESFINCERCFYLDRRLGINQVPGFPFNINSAVDKLLKREFDQYRKKAEPLFVQLRLKYTMFSRGINDAWVLNFKTGKELGNYGPVR